MKYLVEFSGFAYVEAEDEQEAMEKTEDGLYAYVVPAIIYRLIGGFWRTSSGWMRTRNGKLKGWCCYESVCLPG